MSKTEVTVVVYLLLMNAVGFALMGIDKKLARTRQMRVPELMLFAVAVLGGSAGSILGMRVFRHKTKHKSFTVGMPLIFSVQAAFLAYLILK